MEQTTPNRTTKKVNGDSWHAVEADEVLARLATFSESGLSSKEAERRLSRYGPNELEEAPGITFWQMLREQFNNFVVILLIIAAIISTAILVSLLLFWLLVNVTDPPLSGIFSYLALHNKHFFPFMKGTINTRDLIYYLTVTCFFLMVSTRVIEARRWQ